MPVFVFLCLKSQSHCFKNVWNEKMKRHQTVFRIKNQLTIYVLAFSPRSCSIWKRIVILKSRGLFMCIILSKTWTSDVSSKTTSSKPCRTLGTQRLSQSEVPIRDTGFDLRSCCLLPHLSKMEIGTKVAGYPNVCWIISMSKCTGKKTIPISVYLCVCMSGRVSLCLC